MKTMKTQRINWLIIMLLSNTVFFSSCSKVDRTNPYDDKANLSPEEWAPQNLKVEILSFSERKVTWDYIGDERIQGFKIDRKIGNGIWQETYATLAKDKRSWIDNETFQDTELLYYYQFYAFAGENTSDKIPISFKYKLEIGEKYAGGIVFYLNDNYGGLVCAETDQSTGAEWGCYGTTIGGTNIGVGTGEANTIAIVNACNTTGIAAQICYDLVLNNYSDWFLPSQMN